MTENYYLTQIMLPAYFKNDKNKEFFYNVIGRSKENLKIFFEKELYGWVKTDLYRAKVGQNDAVVPEEEKVWNYEPTRSVQDMTDDNEWVTIFVQFPPDFVSKYLDAISIVVAMKGNPEKGLEIRLFMLETGESAVTGEKCVYVCERLVENKEHKNWGTIEFNEKFLSSFRERVYSILTSKDN